MVRAFGNCKSMKNTSLGGFLISRPPALVLNGKYVLCTNEYDVQGYNVESGELVTILHGHQALISSIQSFGDDSAHEQTSNSSEVQAITASIDGEIRLWNVQSGKCLHTYQHPLPQSHVLVSLQPLEANNPLSLSFVVLTARNHTVKHNSRSTITTLHYSMDASLIQAESKPLLSLPYPFSELSISPSGHYLAAIHSNHLLCYDIHLQKGLLHTVAIPFTKVSFDPSDEYVITGDRRGVLHLWYILQDKVFEASHPLFLSHLASPNSSPTLSSSDKKMLQTHLDTLLSKFSLHWHSHGINAISPSASKTVYTGGKEGVLVKWNITNNTSSFLPRLGSPIVHMAIHNNTGILSLADNSLCILNLSIPRIVRVIRGVDCHFRFLEDSYALSYLFDSKNKKNRDLMKRMASLRVDGEAESTFHNISQAPVPRLDYVEGTKQKVSKGLSLFPFPLPLEREKEKVEVSVSENATSTATSTPMQKKKQRSKKNPMMKTEEKIKTQECVALVTSGIRGQVWDVLNNSHVTLLRTNPGNDFYVSRAQANTSSSDWKLDNGVVLASSIGSAPTFFVACESFIPAIPEVRGPFQYASIRESTLSDSAVYNPEGKSYSLKIFNVERKKTGEAPISLSLVTRVDSVHVHDVSAILPDPINHGSFWTLSMDTTVKYWQCKEGETEREGERVREWSCADQFGTLHKNCLGGSVSEDGSLMAVAHGDNTISVWMTRKNALLCTLVDSTSTVGAGREIMGVLLREGGEKETYVIGVSRVHVVCWNLETGKVVSCVDLPKGSRVEQILDVPSSFGSGVSFILNVQHPSLILLYALDAKEGVNCVGKVRLANKRNILKACVLKTQEENVEVVMLLDNLNLVRAELKDGVVGGEEKITTKGEKEEKEEREEKEETEEKADVAFSKEVPESTLLQNYLGASRGLSSFSVNGNEGQGSSVTKQLTKIITTISNDKPSHLLPNASNMCLNILRGLSVRRPKLF